MNTTKVDISPLRLFYVKFTDLLLNFQVLQKDNYISDKMSNHTNVQLSRKNDISSLPIWKKCVTLQTAHRNFLILCQMSLLPVMYPEWFSYQYTSMNTQILVPKKWNIPYIIKRITRSAIIVEINTKDVKLVKLIFCLYFPKDIYKVFLYSHKTVWYIKKFFFNKSVLTMTIIYMIIKQWLLN